MGSDTSKPEVVESELIFVPSQEDGHPILCRVWKPSVEIRGAVFFIHGGMFSKGGLNSHPRVSEALAHRLGLAVITASFRDGSSTTYKSGKYMQDLKSIARYFRSQHATLPFGIVGSSSGGWFALALGNALEKGEVDFLIPLCPVSDPYARAIYLQYCIQEEPEKVSDNTGTGSVYHVRHAPDRSKAILDNQMRFFESLSNMSDAARELEANRHAIPTLMVVGAMDKNVPPQVTQHIQNFWAMRTVSVGGAGHEIQNEFPSNPGKDFVPDLDAFLKTVIGAKETASARRQQEEQQYKTTTSREDDVSPIWLLLLSVSLLLLFCLVASLLNHALDPTTVDDVAYQWPTVEDGAAMALHPLHLVIDFLQVLTQGGARSREFL